MSIRDRFDSIESDLEDGSIDGNDAINLLCELWEETYFEGEDGSISLDEISSRILELMIQHPDSDELDKVDPADYANWW